MSMNEETKRNNKNKKTIIKIIMIVLFLAAMVIMTVQFLPLIKNITDEAGREAYIKQIHDGGFLGWLAVVGLQALQILVALIPGEPIEVFAGVAYGTWGGLATCLVGCFIGTTVVFYLVRLLGYSFVEAIVEKKDLKKFSFLKNEKKLEQLTFAIFLIPATPKDVFTYLAGLTNIKPIKFILIATFARIPSIITSTIAGSALGDGQWITFGIVYGITAIMVAAGLIINNRMMKRRENKQTEEKISENEKNIKTPLE